MFSRSSWMALGRYFLFQVLTAVTFFSAVLVPMYTKWGGLPESYVSRIQAWFMIGALLLDVPTGVFADRYGRKLSLVLGALTCTVGLFLYGSYPSVYVFLAGELILAIGNKLMSGADQALLFASVPELVDPVLHAKVTRMVLLGRRASMIVGAIAGGYIATQWGLNYPIMLTGIPMFMAALVGLTFREVHGEHRPTIRDAIREGYKEVRHNECVRGIMIQMMLSAVPGYFVIWLYQTILERLHVSETYFGYAHSVLLVGQIVMLLGFGWMVRLIGSERKYLVVSSVLSTISYVFAAYSLSYISAVSFILVGGLFTLTRNDILRGYIIPHIRPAYQATVVSYVGMVTSFLIVIMNVVVSVVITYSLSATLLMIGVVPLLALLWLPQAQCFEKRNSE